VFDTTAMANCLKVGIEPTQLLQKKVRLESELDNSVVRKGREATDRGSGCGEFLMIR
jgi:hypothetical protein